MGRSGSTTSRRARQMRRVLARWQRSGPAAPSRIAEKLALLTEKVYIDDGTTGGEDVRMRGADHQQSGMFSYISAEKRVLKDHPLRAIRACVWRAPGAARSICGAPFRERQTNGSQ